MTRGVLLSRRNQLLTLTSLLYLLLSQGLARQHLQYLESDTLFPYSFLADLGQSLANLRGWFTTPNLYFFPDLSVMGLLMLGIRNVWLVHLAYGFCELLALPLLIYWNLGLFSRDRARNWAASLGASSALVLLFTLINSEDGTPISLLAMFLKVGGHSGAVYAGLLFTGLLGRVLQGSRRLVLPLLLLAFIASLSDTLFVLQFMLPGLILLGIDLILCREARWPRLRLVLALLLSMLTARYLHDSLRSLVAFLPTAVPDYSGAAKSWQLFLNDLWQRPFLLFASSAGLFVLLACRRAIHPRYPAFVPLLVFLGGIFSVAAATTTSLYADFGHVRYLYALYLCPVLGLAVLLSFMDWRWPMATGLLFGISMFILEPNSLRFGGPLYQYPADLACLDSVIHRYEVKSGLGGYWDAKYVSYLAHESIRINQILPDGGQWMWITNSAWYRVAADNSGQHDLVLANSLNKASVLQKTGVPPLTVEHCGRFEAWIYSARERPALVKLLR